MVRRITTGPATVQWNINKLDKINDRKLTATYKWCILRLYYALNQEAYESIGPQLSSAVNARNNTAKLLGRAKSTIRSVVPNCIKASRQSTPDNDSALRQVIEPLPYGNRSTRQKKLSPNPELKRKVRDLVREYRNDLKTITAKEVLNFFMERKELCMEMSKVNCEFYFELSSLLTYSNRRACG